MKSSVLIALMLISAGINAYLNKSEIEKYLTREISINEVEFPINAEELSEVDFFKLLDEVTSHKETAEFLNGGLKLKINSNNEASHKIHRRTLELYDLGTKIISSDPELSEIYQYLVSEEILGLNTKLSKVNGMMQSLEEKHGRDYLYQQADPNIQFLMEGIDIRGMNIMEDLLKPSPKKLESIAVKIMPYVTDRNPTLTDLISEKQAKMKIMEVTLMLDLRLGLLMFGTDFQERANNVAEIVRKRLNIDATRLNNERRERLNTQIEKILNQ